MNRNTFNYCLKFCLYNCATLLLTGTVIQAFLLNLGNSESSVSFFFSALQIVQVVIMLFGSGYIERTKNVTTSLLKLSALHICLPITLIFLCIFKKSEPHIAFIIIFAVGILENIFRAITTILDYKLPYHVFDMSQYGKTTGVACTVYGIFGAGLSALMSFMAKKNDYFDVITVFFTLALILEILACFALRSIKPINPENKNFSRAQEKIFVLKYKPFYSLIVPNLFRGICTGIFSVAAVIGHYFDVLSASEAAILVTLMQIATILGSYFYSRMSGKIRDGAIILYSGIAIAVFMPFMLFGNSKTMFLCFYLLSGIAMNFINCSVPVAVTKLVDYNYMGQYSAWRMMLHTLGIALGSGITVFMLNIFGGILTLAISGLLQLASSISYYHILKMQANF